MLKRGDVVLIPFPFSDLSGQKIRPALIISKQNKKDDVVVLFITSRNKSKLSLTVPVMASSQNGLKVPSLVVCDKIATLDKKTIIGSIGRLEEKVQNAVDNAIIKVLGL